MKAINAYLNFDGQTREAMCTDKYGVNWMFNCYLHAAQPA